MPAEPIDVTRDPLLVPLLAFLMAAINADIGQVMMDESGREQDAIASTLIRPQSLDTDPDGARLSAYRLRSKPVRTGFGRIDHVLTLQFDYVTPSCGMSQVEARWPILDRVWVALIEAMSNGSHEAYEDGADALALAGIVWVNLQSAQKADLYAEGDVTFPAFRGTLEVTWRNGKSVDTSALYPALSFTTQIYQGDDVAPTVATSFTALGEDERDADTIEETGEVIL
jgi:hypothetical protein